MTWALIAFWTFSHSSFVSFIWFVLVGVGSVGRNIVQPVMARKCSWTKKEWNVLECLNSLMLAFLEHNNHFFFDLIRYRDSISSFSIEHWVWKIHYQSIFKFQHNPVNFSPPPVFLFCLLPWQRILLHLHTFIHIYMRKTKGFLNSRHNYFAHIFQLPSPFIIIK